MTADNREFKLPGKIDSYLAVLNRLRIVPDFKGNFFHLLAGGDVLN